MCVCEAGVCVCVFVACVCGGKGSSLWFRVLGIFPTPSDILLPADPLLEQPPGT